jgi:hypothetical protein
MRDRYGSVTAQQLADIDWIHDATGLGEVLLTGDKAIAKRPLEARAVVSARARVFALGRNQLSGEEKADRLLRHELAIVRRARNQLPPFVVSINERGLETLRLFA